MERVKKGNRFVYQLSNRESITASTMVLLSDGVRPLQTPLL